MDRNERLKPRLRYLLVAFELGLDKELLKLFLELKQGHVLTDGDLKLNGLCFGVEAVGKVFESKHDVLLGRDWQA